jgi:hypothetical protein
VRRGQPYSSTPALLVATTIRHRGAIADGSSAEADIVRSPVGSRSGRKARGPTQTGH